MADTLDQLKAKLIVANNIPVKTLQVQIAIFNLEKQIKELENKR